MAAERNHLSLSISNTLGSSQSSQQPQPQPTPHVLQRQPASSTGGPEAQDTSPEPTKRGPGRPKGSTKKSLEADPSSPPKLKRPVGRPRKDGRPAGSVPKVSRGPGRPRKNFPPDFAVNTFPQQQQQPHQVQGEQEGWPPLSGMFNNYRLPKEATSEASMTGTITETVNTERPNCSSDTVDTSSSTQHSKWFQAPPTTNAAAASSSSIANALTHPPSVSHTSGPSQLSENIVAASSASGINGNREYEKSTADALSEPRSHSDTSTSIPIPQIPSFILSSVRSLFSRQATRTLPIPRDVLSAYRTHLGHLTGSQAVVYNFLKTFWLPCSPLLFHMVLPRAGSTLNSSNRNSIQHPGTSNGVQYRSNNGDVQNTNTNTSRGSTQDQHNESYRFFYWDPYHLPLSGPINCPICQQASLTHCGPIRTGPLRVFDLPSSSISATSAHVHAGLVPSAFYVIGMQYACPQRTCGARLASWDSRIVNNLPRVVAEEWPVHLASVQIELKGTGSSGDAISRPLFALVNTLAQAGTSEEGIRDVLGKLWDWGESDREEARAEEPERELLLEQEDGNDNEKAAEVLFSSPYQKLWSSHAPETSTNFSVANGQRPAKRHKSNDTTPTIISTTDYSSALFAPPHSTGTDDASSGLAIQLQSLPEHRSAGTHQSPRTRPQQPPRPQPVQAQLKPNQSVRAQPSPRSIPHAHTSHIHTPSPIYPPVSLPNSATHSPQTGPGATLSLKRPLELETRHSSSGAGPPAPPAPATAVPQPSPAQAHFPSLGHSSSFPHLHALQRPARVAQQASHSTHRHPPAPVRPDPPLHMHPSLVHTSNALTRFNPQASLHSPQPMLTAAPPAPQPQPPPPQQHPATQHPAPQRRVRHCVKCGRHDCKGKGGSQFCKNPCKDCSGMDCKGRNSKRPNATCREGW